MTEDLMMQADAVRTSEQGIKCDFCEDVVGSVRRVALHGDYERLRTRHSVQYACPTCFEKKDNQRLGL
jgi:hypothetical protein